MQTRRQSWIEAWVNVLVGYGVAFLAQLFILPLYGAHITLQQNAEMGMLFTIISLLRSYALRRLFNRWHRHEAPQT